MIIMIFALIGMLTVCVIIGVFISPIILWILSFLLDFTVYLFYRPDYQKHSSNNNIYLPNPIQDNRHFKIDKRRIPLIPPIQSFKKAYYCALSENPLDMVINKVYKMIPKGFALIIHAVDSSTCKGGQSTKNEPNHHFQVI